MTEQFDTVYCYPQSDILINNYNIHDSDRLKELERVVTAARLIELYKKPVAGNFDLTHLKKVHYHIFQDIYPWAGELRTVNIAKGYLFCHASFIKQEANKLFARLAQDNFLKNLDFEKLLVKSAYYFGEINAIHPFRDGNGRAQREFFRELLLKSGHVIDYTAFAAKDMIDASIASFSGDNALLINLFRQCIHKL